MFITVLFCFVMIIFCLFMRWVMLSLVGIVAQLGWPDLVLYVGGVPPTPFKEVVRGGAADIGISSDVSAIYRFFIWKGSAWLAWSGFGVDPA